ncbi:MAG: LPS export ABC transporter periplasmic protein LptC [Betaproteobacteria bacterium]|nr:LPS export ABC transporter periplasmic protein LptC [Betaproteobacteria bacterium]
MRATLLLPLAALMALVALTFWLERQVSADAYRATKAAATDPDVIIDNFNATKMGPDGSLKYRLNARRMTHYPAGDTSKLDKVSFESRSPDQPTIRVTAEGGTVTQGGEVVVMEGNVVMNADATETSPAWTLSTEKLTMLPKENIARSDTSVLFKSRDLNMTASAFTFNTKTRVADLRNIRAVYISKRNPERK